MSQFVVGLSGGIGSGKTTVSNMFAKLGVQIIDADVIARQVVQPDSPALATIIDKFGPQLLDPDGNLDRRKLRDIVFSHSAAKQWLNGLLHPLIQQQMQQQTRQAKSIYCILSVPLLVENQSYKTVDRVAIVDVPENLQRSRTINRDAASETQINAIMASQATRQQRLEVADDVIDNSGDEAALSAQVYQLHQRYVQMAGEVLGQQNKPGD
ncbi:MAG: dephospho-CoA kinase [Paraglaciecola sp.]|jgi:dephospho-CoA kinase